MLVKLFQFFTVVFAALICGSVSGQDCSSCGNGMLVNGGGYASAPAALSYSGANYSSYGDFGGAGYVGDDCGRGISYSQAASLWSGYCTETCNYPGGSGGGGCSSGGCRLGGMLGGGQGGMLSGGGGCGAGGGCGGGGKRGLLRGLFGKFGGGGLGGGFGGGGGCCDQGCFGYPSGGCGCGGGGGFAGGGFGGGGFAGGGLFGGKLFSGRGSRGCGGGGGGCKLFGGGGGGCKLFGGGGGGLFGGGGGGCKLFGRKRGGMASGFMNAYQVAYVSPTSFDVSASQCGSNNAYFNEFVGPEYGTAGMQSVVSGCTSGCGGSAIGYGDAAGYNMGGTMDAGYGATDGQIISGGQTYGYGMGQPAVNPGEVYMGQHDPTANAKEIIGEAVDAAADAAGSAVDGN